MSTFFPTVRPLYKFLWLFYRLNGVWFVVMNQVEVSREKKNWRNDECEKRKKNVRKKNIQFIFATLSCIWCPVPCDTVRRPHCRRIKSFLSILYHKFGHIVIGSRASANPVDSFNSLYAFCSEQFYSIYEYDPAVMGGSENTVFFFSHPFCTNRFILSDFRHFNQQPFEYHNTTLYRNPNNEPYIFFSE